ncbi:MAG: 30S ribosomal protein S20 [Candidatus Aminicenantales bacterium]
MAHHHSAIRQWHRSLRRTAINKKNKSVLRSQTKKLKALIENKDKENANKLLPEVISTIDKTVKKGAIHKKRGSRFKSRLSRHVKALNSASSK